MSNWIQCPNCGTMMTVTTSGYLCPMCGTALPVKILHMTSGTSPEVNAVPVIRCKDCMFYQTDKGGWCLDHDDDVLWLDDSYCSRAVRKKE